jgi:hypothetical protein
LRREGSSTAGSQDEDFNLEAYMRNLKFGIRMFVPVLLCLFAICPMTFAQVTNASLTGEITDSSGAVLPGVLIQVQNTATNATQTAETNTSGVYLVAPLNPGSYKISVEKKGFNKIIQTGITLTVGQAATLNIVLKVGDIQEIVTVTADAELINTTTAEIGTTVGEDAVRELPLNGRNPSNLVMLSSGVVNVINTGGGTLQGETTMPDESGASAGGGRQGSTYYMLDGAPRCHAGIPRHHQQLRCALWLCAWRSRQHSNQVRRKPVPWRRL